MPTPPSSPIRSLQNETAQKDVLALIQSYTTAGTPPVSVQDMVGRITTTLKEAIQLAKAGAATGGVAPVSGRGLTSRYCKAGPVQLRLAGCAAGPYSSCGAPCARLLTAHLPLPPLPLPPASRTAACRL